MASTQTEPKTKYYVRKNGKPQQSISPADLEALRRACHSLVLKAEHYNPSEPPAELSPSPSPTPSLCGSPAEPASPYTDPTTVDSRSTSPSHRISRLPNFSQFNKQERSPPMTEETGIATYASPDKSHIPDPVFTTFDFGFGTTQGVAVVGKPVLVSVTRSRAGSNLSAPNLLDRPKTASYIERKPVRADMFPTPPPQPKTFEEIMGWASSPTDGTGARIERPLPPVPRQAYTTEVLKTGYIRTENVKAQKAKTSSGWKGVGKKVGHLSTFMKGWKTK